MISAEFTTKIRDAVSCATALFCAPDGCTLPVPLSTQRRIPLVIAEALCTVLRMFSCLALHLVQEACLWCLNFAIAAPHGSGVYVVVQHPLFGNTAPR